MQSVIPPDTPLLRCRGPTTDSSAQTTNQLFLLNVIEPVLRVLFCNLLLAHELQAEKKRK